MFGVAFITPLAALRPPPPSDASPQPSRHGPLPPTRSLPRRALLAAGVVSTASALFALASRNTARAEDSNPRTVSEEVWSQRLSPQAYRVLRQSGTERPFTSAFNKEKRAGKYVCGACAAVGTETELFASDTKFDSGTGWPSFYSATPNVELVQSGMDKLMMQRECRCSACGSHLGHVFRDGPRPTGLRHCINGVALEFRPDSRKAVKSVKTYPASNVA